MKRSLVDGHETVLAELGELRSDRWRVGGNAIYYWEFREREPFHNLLRLDTFRKKPTLVHKVKADHQVVNFSANGEERWYGPITHRWSPICMRLIYPGRVSWCGLSGFERSGECNPDGGEHRCPIPVVAVPALALIPFIAPLKLSPIHIRRAVLPLQLSLGVPECPLHLPLDTPLRLREGKMVMGT